MNIVERFIKYVKVDTQSDPNNMEAPSTKKQLTLANILVDDMKAVGIGDAHVDTYGIVYGTLASNIDKKVETIGFIAHMDTAPDMSGENVNPRIIKNYDGGEIILNEALNISMSPKMFDNLNGVIGKDIIVTDGTTLLGADDKAGVTEIMEMCKYFYEHPEVKHGTIKIAFTPDEEVGRGADHFNVKKFAADYAYTVDGGDINSIDYENFNAASAEVLIQGSSIHPGDAKDKLVNASKLAMEFHMLLPIELDPAKTSGREGFNHLTYLNGHTEHAEMEYIIRNHDKKLFENQKEEFYHARDIMNEKYGDVISVEIKDSYYNMANLIETRMSIVDDVKRIMKEMGLQPTSTPIRGGTDGSRLSYEGLLCPNIGTGGANFHGKYEYVCIQSMETIRDLIINIVKDKAK
ncbi:tripeptide aminopeptidase [Breznakia sp. PF5-3]|uniref:peptidase T n=1 Tax=unclassified Breznakia TaxID=2623764 RepID=UPI0024071FC0|nr:MULTISPECIES: peptidase T [unclassified Breznakia]MDF9825695.1 tripeptide aminopeptidase [Breznakia sp. PM6-1]MDF9836524.1 tripeptide aminopeptidase [Breznakia sp. PF5-3]MDF9837589.1 tripeptide aminopeptidase [Breznakia sp. PFB2-8]MDF9860758.1 tripeptide aminopeptidase [Breznakia sp. PH5-24]